MKLNIEKWEDEDGGEVIELELKSPKGTSFFRVIASTFPQKEDVWTAIGKWICREIV